DEHLFVSSQGTLCRVTDMVPVERMQELRLTQGPLSRLRKRVTLSVDTPPGPADARAPGRDANEGRALLDTLVRHGRQARVPAAGTERWETRANLTRERPSRERPESDHGDAPGGMT